MSGRNAAIERFRYIAALLVIGIHTGIFSDVNDTLYFFMVQIVCRVAVPFFAVCTGYFLGAKANDSAVLAASAKRQWTKLIKNYTIYTAVYLLFSIPAWLQSGWFSAWAFADYAIGAVSRGSHYHLWYLLSLIYALPLFYLLLVRLRKSQLLPVSILLYLIKSLMYGYRRWMPDPIQTVFAYLDKASGITDAVFLILPLLLSDAYIARRCGTEKIKIKTSIGLACAFLLLAIEAFCLRYAGQETVSFILFTYPTAYFLFLVILNQKNIKNEKLCRHLGAGSLFIYCVHPMIVESLGAILCSTIQICSLTAIIATALGLVYTKLSITKRRS